MGGQERPGSYRDLRVWQQSMELAAQCYVVSRSFPNEERFGLTGQLRRACVSVPCNIAEGSGRSTRREYAQFLHVARGSLRELDTLMLLSIDVGIAERCKVEPLLALSESVGRQLLALIRSLGAVRSDD